MAKPTGKIITIKFRNRKGRFTKYRKDQKLSKEYYLKGKHKIAKETPDKVKPAWSRYVPFYVLHQAKAKAKKLKIKLPKKPPIKELLKKIRRDIKRGKLAEEQVSEMIREYRRAAIPTERYE